MAPKKEEQASFSDSDRASLDELLRDKEFKAELAKRRKALTESVKAWAIWITSVTAAVVVIWDKFLSSAIEWLKRLFV